MTPFTEEQLAHVRATLGDDAVVKLTTPDAETLACREACAVAYEQCGQRLVATEFRAGRSQGSVPFIASGLAYRAGLAARDAAPVEPMRGPFPDRSPCGDIGMAGSPVAYYIDPGAGWGSDRVTRFWPDRVALDDIVKQGGNITPLWAAR